MVPALLQDSVVGAEVAVHGTTATPFHCILRAAALEDCRCEVPSSKQQDQQHGHNQGAVLHPFYSGSNDEINLSNCCRLITANKL